MPEHRQGYYRKVLEQRILKMVRNEVHSIDGDLSVERKTSVTIEGVTIEGDGIRINVSGIQVDGKLQSLLVEQVMHRLDYTLTRLRGGG